MATQFRCHDPGRRQAVLDHKTLNGIDFLEVTSADEKTLAVHFLFDLPGGGGANPKPPAPPLKPENFLVEGGTRIQGVQVVSASSAGNVLTLKVDRAGDFSTYTLRLVASPAGGAAGDRQPPPDGFDQQLAAVDFSFKVACPSDFDCRPDDSCPPARLAEPRIDYLAKDYATFRLLLLDRLSVLMPGWRERNPADVEVTLVELLAYVADHLSYQQDAVATEAYLGTARRRTSVRRHVRPLDYFVHEGCNARAWVWLRLAAGTQPLPLPAGTRLLTGGPDGRVVVPAQDLERLLAAEDPLVFETLHDVVLRSAHDEIPFYTWSDAECCLPRGSTRATLRNGGGVSLARGDVLVFEEVLDPRTGQAADADPAHRWAVRLSRAEAGVDRLDNTPVVEIEWPAADALPFPLCLTALVEPGPLLVQVSVARCNVVLADHGRSFAGVPPEPPAPAPLPAAGGVSERFRPRLQHTGITFRVPFDQDAAIAAATLQPAVAALVQDPRQALPRVTLSDPEETWTAVRDLLGSDRFAADFVVEVETDGTASLRFGNDVLGRSPTAAAPLAASYRVGNGAAGNVGAGAISRVVFDLPGIEAVRNPLPAAGGTDPESLEEVRQYAPQAFRVQERAVTADDYAAVAERHPEVQKAAARLRWTGSWYTVFLTVDRRGGAPVDAAFADAIRAFLERFRMAGYDLEVEAPLFVPLDLLLRVCVAPGYFRGHVEQALLAALGRRDLPDGRPGFFHPDNFTFGQPVYLSQVYGAAMAVDGVASVEVLRFQRWGKLANQEIQKGALIPAALEIVRLDNDRSFPENGRLELDMQGAL